MVAPIPSPASPAERLRRELIVREGPVPDRLGDAPLGLDRMVLHAGAFLLREPRIAMHYRPGEGVTVQRGPGWTAALEELYLHGSMCAAIASLNGFLPLHASAVAVDGRVAALTAPAGGGKSTLAAGLAGLGLPLFCDDTLVTELSPEGSVLCLPGHKRMKLWPDAVELTGSTPLEQVSDDYAKFYVTASGSAVADETPLGALIFLEDGPEPKIVPVEGGEKVALLCDDHYTRMFHAQANALDRAAQFALQARIAVAAPMFRFIRPRDRARFAETTRFLADALSAMMGG